MGIVTSRRTATSSRVRSARARRVALAADVLAVVRDDVGAIGADPVGSATAVHDVAATVTAVDPVGAEAAAETVVPPPTDEVVAATVPELGVVAGVAIDDIVACPRRDAVVAGAAVDVVVTLVAADVVVTLVAVDRVVAAGAVLAVVAGRAAVVVGGRGHAVLARVVVATRLGRVGRAGDAVVVAFVVCEHRARTEGERADGREHECQPEKSFHDGWNTVASGTCQIWRVAAGLVSVFLAPRRRALGMVAPALRPPFAFDGGLVLALVLGEGVESVRQVPRLPLQLALDPPDGVELAILLVSQSRSLDVVHDPMIRLGPHGASVKTPTWKAVIARRRRRTSPTARAAAWS